LFLEMHLKFVYSKVSPRKFRAQINPKIIQK
jgi:hypothetical protein